MLPSHAARLFDPLMVDAAVAAILSDAGYVQRMLAFEAALARAEAAVGVIPFEAGLAISRAVETLHAAELDELATAIAVGTAKAGSPVIPLVTLLTARTEAQGQPYVHWGATTQDVMDTALVLQWRDIAALFEAELAELADALAGLARQHRDTPMVARTVMQHALPTTFGLKAAGWLTVVLRHRERLAQIAPRTLCLQLGGAAGTLASLGAKGSAVADRLASELGLGLAATPWHSARDRIGEIAAFCGLLCGTLGKVGRDIVLLMQTDVQEVFEPAAAGRGGSSTMPHKRNPVLASVMVGAGTATPGLVSTILSAQMHEHERAAGSGHAEWRTLPELLKITSGALKAAVALAGGLDVRADRMRSNLEQTRGLIMAEAVMMALGQHLGRLGAHHHVDAACKRAIADDMHLCDAVLADAVIMAYLSPQQVAALFDPQSYLGSAGSFVDAALAAHAHSKHAHSKDGPAA
jgi:3-carboxy-cis,cis-muconate cycloisomerase